ncbi:MAG: glycine--tRNA ligase [Thermoprotei archaeon]|nr:MAG: glycine--tRNA ligase [Thermoprotei archaeon]
MDTEKAEIKTVQKITIQELASFCARLGFFYPSGRIYGGLSGFYDYGPLGAELRREILNDWWWYFVERRDDILGIHGSIITHPQTWVASGHVDSFIDFIVTCKRCGAEYRADHLLEDMGIAVPELTLETLSKLIEDYGVRCPKCRGELGNPTPFNLMFTTYVGPKKTAASLAYLRPETAQLIFTNFRNIIMTMGVKLPFGIAQYGKAFRNEISPRGFLFRLREFEQMEIEYFVNPEKLDDCSFYDEVKGMEINLLSAEMQEKGEKEGRWITIEEAVDKGLIGYKWHAYWIAESLRWLRKIGINYRKLRVREHVKTELAHYAVQTFDVEFLFPQAGWKEIEGISNRSDYDLKKHQEYSGAEMYIYDDGKKVIPYVIEPSFGLERIILAVLFSAYNEVKGRKVLSLHPKIAPIKVGVFPLVSKPGFIEKAKKIYDMLKEDFKVIYEAKDSIGRRYARADERGVPLCITIDGQTLNDDTVTIRFRDTREQIRVHISDLKEKIRAIFREWSNKNPQWCLHDK